MNNPPVCGTCGKNRWRTLEKGKRYVCRNCGKIRDKRKYEQKKIDQNL
jgi:hypothetical protein